MAKVTINTISTLENNSSLTKINENFSLLVAELDNLLSLDGTSPSTMLSDLDMNSNQILNLPDATTDQEPLTYGQFNTYYADILAKAAQVASDKLAVAALYDSFDDRYLGSKSVEPTVDNDGQTLLTGATYWNSVDNFLYYYNGSAWESPVELALNAVAELGFYLGSATSDPTVDGDGNPLEAGDMYFNTVLGSLKVYDGSAWQVLATYNQSLNTTDDVVFNSVTTPSLVLSGGTGSQGTVSWNTDEETLDLIQNGATLQLGQEVQVHCRNNTGATIANGTPVMATGTLGASGRITIAKMDGTNPDNAKYFIGITTEDIPNGEDGKVTSFGKVRGIDTTDTTIFTGTIADGDVLYVDPATAGKLTNTEPTGSNINMPVAFVIYAASNGTIMARATAINENHFATYAQGQLALTATQPGDNVSDLVNDAGYLTSETYTGTVTSVGFTAGTGIGITGTNPITSSGTVTITNSAPDQTVTLTEGSNVTITGTYPNFTIASTDTNTTYTAGSGLTLTGTAFSANVGTDIQAWDADLDAIAGLAGTSGFLTKTGANTWALDTNTYLTSETYTGTVTSVGMTVPTGLAVTGSPITSSGTLALAMDTGYSIPTTASQTNWNTAYGWGDHSTQGYLTTVTASDVDSGVAADGYVLTSDGLGGAAWEAVAGSGTVTSVAMTVPTGLTVSGSPITGSGTLAVAFDTGYSIPTTANQTNWTTAYNWGDHSLAGYLTTETYTGTVTSVNLTAGTGMSVSGGPITSSGSITVTNTAPDQTVTLTQGSNVTITGTYPNFTIASTDTNTTYTAGAGLTLTGTSFSANIGTDIQAYDADTMKTDVAQTMTAQLTVKETAETNYNLTGLDVDPANGTIQYKTTTSALTGANAITGTNFANGQSVTLRLTAATGVEFSGFNWVTSDGAAPTIGSNNDVFVLWMDNSVKFVAYVGHD